MTQRGIIHLLPLVLIAALVVGVILVLTGKFKLPSVPFGQKQPKVELKTEYKNPFNKESQYVNPFDQYKNPFVTNR